MNVFAAFKSEGQEKKSSIRGLVHATLRGGPLKQVPSELE